jgi:uncharacterized protein (TIGR03435 family)
MLQALLRDRFTLQTHREIKAISGYQLGVENGRHRLQPVSSDPDRQGFSVVSMQEIRGPGSMPALARALSGVLAAPVEDVTGLSGSYDIELKWSPDERPPAGSSDSGDGVVKAGEPSLSLFTAAKLQLGLALKPDRVPVEMIVIDSAEKQPTEN